MKFPLYETQRLLLDEIKTTDINSIFELFSNNEVTKYYDLDVFKYQVQSENLISLLNERFNKSLGIRWAIRVKDQNQCIGTCGFNSWNETFHSTTIGYDLNRDYWGKGYITEALFKIIDSAFSGNLACKQINRIQADTVPGNGASEAVLKKLGFKDEGVRRESGYWKKQLS